MKKLSEIMTSEVQVIPPTCTIKDAAKKMKELDTGALPICDGDRLLGMVTDRDIAIRAIANGYNPTQMAVKEIMSKPIAYCFDDQDVEEAVRVMEVKQIRRLVVLNRDKRLVGLVSLGDVASRAYQE